MAFKLAEMFVDITGRDGGLNSTLASVQQKIGAASVTLGNLASTAIMAGIGAGAGQIKGAIVGAVELQDVANQNKVVFGDMAQFIEAEADRMAEKFGVVRSEFMAAAGTFGTMLKGAGNDRKDAVAMGNQLAKLAYDMRSFKGGATTTAEAVEAIGAAFRGEFNQLERFNVFLTADAIAAEAVAKGLAKSKTEVSNYAKQQAAISLVMKQTVDQQGDMERTANDAGNQWLLLTGTLINFRDQIGAAVLPTLNTLLVQFNSHLKPAIQSMGVVVRNAGDIWEIWKLQATEVLSNVVARVVAFGENVGMIAKFAATNWKTLFLDAINAVAAAFQNLSNNAYNFGTAIGEFMLDPTKGFNFEWTPLLDGFEATTEKLPDLIRPALVSMEGDIEKINDRIAGRELERLEKQAADRAALAGFKGGEQKAAVGAKGKDAGKTVGLEQFAKDLQEGVFGKDDTAKKQLEVAEKSKEIQAKQLDVLTKARAATIAVAG